MPAMEYEEHCCPFLNATDVHCDRYVRLDRLKLAFDYCFAAYELCPEYRRLGGESAPPVPGRVLVQVRLRRPEPAVQT
jgi:hypothetical protein